MRRRDFLQTSLATAALWPAQILIAADAVAVADLPARTLAGAAISLRGVDVKDLAASMRGPVLISGQDGYDSARRVWNAMFDKKPAVIARCASPSDVMRAVTFAREHQLLTAVRSGGHSLSGKSTCDGGIVIDMSLMQSVRVDPKARIARVEGGSLLQHLDRETKAFNLVTTAGTVSHTGAAGLTLGGGFGRVGRRFGLACDNLSSVDIVTADGRWVTASDAEHPDLFWGLRGGGGNFGVATSFEYRLHPMDPTILGGVIAWPAAQAREVLRFYAEFSQNAPDELNTDPNLVPGPEGKSLIAVEVCWSGDKPAGERALQPLRSFGRPLFDKIGAMPYVALQSSGDANAAAGNRFYSKSGFFTRLTPEIVDALVDAFESAATDRVLIALQQGGGAIGRQAVSSAAFPNRRANYWAMVASSWQDPSLDERNMAAARNAWKRIEPLTSGFYVNAMTDEEAARVGANYGANYPRLQQVKSKYDPENLFRLNANVRPG